MSDRDEWRAAMRIEGSRPGDCYRHDMQPDHNGGLTCPQCGVHVTGDEL